MFLPLLWLSSIFSSPAFDERSDLNPLYIRDTVMNIDLIAKQNFNYASPISCDNSSQNETISGSADETHSPLQKLFQKLARNCLKTSDFRLQFG